MSRLFVASPRLTAALLGVAAMLVTSEALAQCPTREQVARGFRIQMTEGVVYEVFPADSPNTVTFREHVKTANGVQTTMVTSYKGLINSAQQRGNKTVRFTFDSELNDDYLPSSPAREARHKFLFTDGTRFQPGSLTLRLGREGRVRLAGCEHPVIEFEKITTFEDESSNVQQTIKQRIIYSRLLRMPIAIETAVEGGPNAGQLNLEPTEIKFNDN